ncbi:MAG: amidophosphoribosyltransferase [Deltaproteobacteria bacterium]|nr:amidophosphoribosyltransferase [Deltaproteobacteria bacterium]
MALDKFREECGLMGVWNHPEAANLVYLGLYAQQHRGQEGAGVVSVSNNGRPRFHIHKGIGLVSEVFQKYDFGSLPGKQSIGHVRYTTAGGNHLSNVQPFYAEISSGGVVIAHNGNLINADTLREQLIDDGAIFASSSDTEAILHLLARSPGNLMLVERVISALHEIKGAFSLLLMFGDRMIAVRDPNGLRPLALGSLGDGLVVASETCAFDLIGAKYLRDIEPVEVLEISGESDTKSYFPFGVTRPSPCIFEYVYFARPDSNVFGKNVYPIRKRMGQELAREHPVPADYVIPVPDSGVTAAIGYAQEAGIPLELGLIRNHYVGRTFIEPQQSIRDFGVKIKLNANSELLKGKRIVVVDDSIVRGTTSKKLVKMLKQAGASEVHMRISAPPTIDPCYYGIDTPQKEELIASRKSIPEIAEYLGVKSLAYLSMEGLYRAVGEGTFCDACFSGNYPIGTPKRFEKRQTELELK